MLPQEQYKVLLIGETCEDQYVYGKVERISPEAPVPVVRYERTESSKGMSANVKANLESFGVFVNHITNKTPIVKKRIVDVNSNQQLLRIDEEQRVDSIRPSEVKSAFIHMKYDAVVISDYDKGYLTTEHLKLFSENFDGPVFVDTKKTDLYSSPNTFFKINQKEFGRLLKTPDEKNLIVTLGEMGASYMDKVYPTQRVNVFDVVGAGDTFLAALTYGYLKYGDIESGITIANVASSIAVQHYGCYTLTQEEAQSL